jgi:hypothetical protein
MKRRHGKHLAGLALTLGSACDRCVDRSHLLRVGQEFIQLLMSFSAHKRKMRA